MNNLSAFGFCDVNNTGAFVLRRYPQLSKLDILSVASGTYLTAQPQQSLDAVLHFGVKRGTSLSFCETAEMLRVILRMDEESSPNNIFMLEDEWIVRPPLL